MENSSKKDEKSKKKKQQQQQRPEFQIYNTMTKEKEIFKPKVPGKVGMYVCGVTAYDFSHMGHARAYVAFDLLYRWEFKKYPTGSFFVIVDKVMKIGICLNQVENFLLIIRFLQYLGYEVNYVRNFTDVDDKIIQRANALGEDPIHLSGRFCNEFHTDMDNLQCLPPSSEPRVSDHMSQIIDMISQIINNGVAYVVDGDVFFSVDKFPNYGRLSGRKLEDNRAGERVIVDLRKKNPFDFALWKSAKPGEPSWDSPWGPGRPGWHIECSAMSARYLSFSFDIHGGGMDLVFPHHENEIAQSSAACSESHVKYWMHNGFITNNFEKMSKSQGNFFTIRDVSRLYHPLALRIFLMGAHYRSPVNYSNELLNLASERVFYIYQTLEDCEAALSQYREGNVQGKVTPDADKCIQKFRTDFENFMADDLQTPPVLAAILEPLKTINNILKSFKGKKQPQTSLIQSLIALEKEVKDVLTVLGLTSSSTCSEVLRQLKDKALIRADITEDQVLQQIEERDLARKNKEYAKSDEIRKRLADIGISLMDDPKSGGTIWRPSPPAQQQQPAGDTTAIAKQQKPAAGATTPNEQQKPATGDTTDKTTT